LAVALSVEGPAATPLKVKAPLLCPESIVNTEGDTATSFADELTSATVTPPGPAGVPKAMLPLIMLPTSIDEVGRAKVIPGEVTLNAALVVETRPGLLATSVKPLPAVVTLTWGKDATP
jgi:hypothetical protein